MCISSKCLPFYNYALKVDDLKAYSHGLKATHYCGCVNNRMIHLELQKTHLKAPAHLHNIGFLISERAGNKIEVIILKRFWHRILARSS